MKFFRRPRPSFLRQRARVSPLDMIFRALTFVGVLEIVALTATLIGHFSAPGLIGQGLFFRLWIGLLIGPAILLVGGLIVWRVPGNITGRFLVLIALGAIGAQFDFDLGAPIPSALVMEAFILFNTGLVAPCLGFLMMTFPTGRIYPPQLTRVVIIVVIVKFTGTLLEILSSPGKVRIFIPSINPLFLPALAVFRPVIAWTIGITGLLLPLTVLAGLISLVLRYRVSSAPERQQIKWVLWGFGLLISTGLTAFVLLFRYGATSSPFQVAFVFAASAQVLCLASIAIAILRYHLFDIDVVINRTLVYGSLTLIIVGIYVVVVGYVDELLHERLFHESGRFIFSLLATGLIAVLFQPLRDRLQRVVNRFVYGDRDDPYAVLSRLGLQLEATLVSDSVLPTIVETVAQTLRLPYAAITLRETDSDHVAAAYGLPSAYTIAFPLDYQRDLIGHLQVAQRSPTEPFTSAERRLLEDITRQIEVAVHNVRLAADLQRSRERLVTTREEERRRIRRDLHDGLGPKLAGQTLKLEAALDSLDRDPEATRLLLADMLSESQAVVIEIRRLVYGLRPPALDELGLLAAVREQAERHTYNGLHVIVSAPETLPPLPAAIEVATYRIIQEALTNVVRHAQAKTCMIDIAVEDEMRLAIQDDGLGLPLDRRAGVGLNSMRERAEEIGGVCVVEAIPTGGTVVRAQLPISDPSSSLRTILR